MDDYDCNDDKICRFMFFLKYFIFKHNLYFMMIMLRILLIIK